MKYLCLFTMLLNCVFADPAKAQHTLSFAENKGQWHANALYRAEIPGGAMFISNKGPVYHFASEADLLHIHEQAQQHPGTDFTNTKVRVHAYQLKFIRSNPQPAITGSNMISYYENFFSGNDPSKWAGKVRHFKTVTQKNIFDHIDLVYYAKEKSLKYDFIVKPGGAPESIQLQMDGAKASINAQQQLVIQTSVNTVTEDAPVAFQVINGETLYVACRYRLQQDIIGFETGKYNQQYPLIIDPDLIFATYSGAQSSNFYSYTSTFDYAGNTITAALGFGMGWPVQTGAYDVTFNNVTDVALMKLNPTGTTRMFATYLGGSGAEFPYSLASSPGNHIFLIGNTLSLDFPVTTNAIQHTFGGGPNDIFLSKISSDGTQLLASTYLGGNGTEGATTFTPIAATNKSPSVLRFNENDHSLWFTSSSESTNFPVTANALHAASTYNGPVLVQVDTNLSQLKYSTFFNINGETFFHDLKYNNKNQLFLCGNTAATGMGTANSLNPNYLSGTADGFVMKFNANSKAITAFTYLGTAATDIAAKLALTPGQEKVYVSGASTGSYPISANAYSQPNSYNYIQCLDSSLTSNQGACTFGGTDFFFTSDIYVSTCNALGIAGIKYSNNFPTTANAYSTSGEFWFGNFNLSLTNLTYGTCYGYGGHSHSGTFSFDPGGNIHHSVCDIGGTFVTSPNAWSPTKQTSGYDMISFKFDITNIDKLLSFSLSSSSRDTGCAPHQVSFVNHSYNYDSYHWDLGNGTTSNVYAPAVNYTTPGVYKVVLTGYNQTCNFEDKDSMYIVVKATQIVRPYASDTTVCSHVVPLNLKLDSISPANFGNYYTIDWQPHAAIIGNYNGTTAAVNPKIAADITVYIRNNNNDSVCITDTFVTIKVHHFDSTGIKVQPPVSEICSGDSVLITASGGISYSWTPATGLQFIDDHTVYSRPDASVTYQISITDTIGCIYERSSTVTVLERDKVDAGPDQAVKFGEPAQLHGITNSSNFYWLVDHMPAFHNNPSPVVHPTDTSLYYLIGVNSNGCTAMDSVFVYVNDFKIPNVFSPNGDGLNDDFFPIPYNDYAEIINFSIYNRYGQRIFYTHKLRQAWDGRHQDRDADLGVYIYHVEYKIGAKTYHLKGDVTLIR